MGKYWNNVNSKPTKLKQQTLKPKIAQNTQHNIIQNSSWKLAKKHCTHSNFLMRISSIQQNNCRNIPDEINKNIIHKQIGINSVNIIHGFVSKIKQLMKHNHERGWTEPHLGMNWKIQKTPLDSSRQWGERHIPTLVGLKVETRKSAVESIVGEAPVAGNPRNTHGGFRYTNW